MATDYLCGLRPISGMAGGQGIVSMEGDALTLLVKGNRIQKIPLPHGVRVLKIFPWPVSVIN